MPEVKKERNAETAPLLPSTLSLPRDATVDEVLCHIGVGPFQYFMLFALGLTYTADAAEVLLMSFVGPDVKCDWGISSTEQSLITSVVFIGMALGSFLFGILSNLKGRKPTTLIDVALTAACGLLSAASPNLYWLLLFRFLTGVGLGGFVLMISMFSEFLPIQNRGRILCSYQFFWTVGAVFEVVAAWVIMPRYYWRGLIVVSSLPLVLLLFILPFVPESPRFLAVSGRLEKAKEVLEKIAARNGTTLPPDLQLHYNPPSQEKPSPWAYFIEQFRAILSPPFDRITPILWLNWVGAAFAYYGVVILTTAIQSDSEEGEEDDCTAENGDHVEFSDGEYLGIMIDGLAELPATIFTMYTIDYFGRRKLMMSTWTGLAFSMALLPISPSFLHTAVLFSARFFIMSTFNVILTMAPEVYPSSCRSFAIGFGNQLSRSGGACAPFGSQALYDAAGVMPVALIFATFSVVAGTSCYFFPFETAGSAMLDTHTVQNNNRPKRTSPALANV